MTLSTSYSENYGIVILRYYGRSVLTVKIMRCSIVVLLRTDYKFSIIYLKAPFELFLAPASSNAFC